MRIIARISCIVLALLGCNADNGDTLAVEDLPAEQAAAFCELFLVVQPGALRTPLLEGGRAADPDPPRLAGSWPAKGGKPAKGDTEEQPHGGSRRRLLRDARRWLAAGAGERKGFVLSRHEPGCTIEIGAYRWSVRKQTPCNPSFALYSCTA